MGERRLMVSAKANVEKIAWSGRIVAVQPRICLMRSFDQRYHVYQGYVLRIDGAYEDNTGEFIIAVGKGAHEKHRFRAGMELSGFSVPVNGPRVEVASYYKTSGIMVFKEPKAEPSSTPPFQGVPCNLETYRSRGHRRLDTKTYENKCTTCVWGCRMPVEITLDHWNPSKKQYRFETFCYGPKSCPFYKAGATRKVPGRGGMTWRKKTGSTRMQQRTEGRTTDEYSETEFAASKTG